MAGRRSVRETRDTRQTILRRAADMASVEGLEGLTVGNLAAALGMSKAGVMGHFGSKLELQLATLAYAAEVFRTEVWLPVEHVSEGMPRLLAICRTWMSYAGRPAFPGGCFLTSASYEFDNRPGEVHDALAGHLRRWHDRLTGEIRIAVASGDLPTGIDPEQVSYTLEAIAARVSPAFELLGDRRAADHAEALMLHVLGRPPSTLLAPQGASG